MTMAAMAPEDRCEDDLDAWGIVDGRDPGKDDSEALVLVDGLDTIEIEDVVASAPDQRMDSRLWGMGGNTPGWNHGRGAGDATWSYQMQATRRCQ